MGSNKRNYRGGTYRGFRECFSRQAAEDAGSFILRLPNAGFIHFIGYRKISHEGSVPELCHGLSKPE